MKFIKLVSVTLFFASTFAMAEEAPTNDDSTSSQATIIDLLFTQNMFICPGFPDCDIQNQSDEPNSTKDQTQALTTEQTSKSK